MPLWQIFHTAAALAEPHSRAWLAGNITNFYVKAGLPSFYVNVLFQPIAGDDMWIGGHPATISTIPRDAVPLERPFVRMAIQHVAIHRGGNETAMVDMCNRLDKVLEPHLEGYDWEYNIIEPDSLLWRINGLQPPPRGSAAEQAWINAGKPVLWQ